jgi:hypothetical protein
LECRGAEVGTGSIDEASKWTEQACAELDQQDAELEAGGN